MHKQGVAALPVHTGCMAAAHPQSGTNSATASAYAYSFDMFGRGQYTVLYRVAREHQEANQESRGLCLLDKRCDEQLQHSGRSHQQTQPQLLCDTSSTLWINNDTHYSAFHKQRQQQLSLYLCQPLPTALKPPAVVQCLLRASVQHMTSAVQVGARHAATW
jgi:hypothetical protein